MVQALRARPMISAGLIVIAVMLIACIAAPLLTSVDPQRMNVMQRLSPPSVSHYFGTDDFGRDVFARVLYAGRVSFAVGFLVTVFACLIGTIAGIMAGFFPRLDALISRCLEALMAFPDILLAIALMAAFGPSLVNVVFALSFVYAPRVARVIRASTLALRPLPFVDAAIAIGGTNTRILVRHLLPNLIAPLLVQATFVFAYSMLSEAALSFLGAGVPPETPTFGTMISFGQAYIGKADWMMIFPGIAIALSVMSLQLVGDGLRDALDPVLSRAR
jgi:peptide/nickel transport system permease protein